MSVIVATTIGDLVIDFDHDIRPSNTDTGAARASAIKRCIAAVESGALTGSEARADTGGVLRLGAIDGGGDSSVRAIVAAPGAAYILTNTDNDSDALLIATSESEATLPMSAVRVGAVAEGLDVARAIVATIDIITVTDSATLVDPFAPQLTATDFAEAERRADMLTLLGDLPSSSTKPRENVLFVAKLNPVTTSEDLALIFSRFGTIVECRVVIDKVTKKSLGYAFIEYESREQCETAYIKMKQAVIDDRKIVVDFSQSTSRERREERQREQERERERGRARDRSYERRSDDRERRRESRDRDRDRRSPKRKRSRSCTRSRSRSPRRSRRRHRSCSRSRSPRRHHRSYR